MAERHIIGDIIFEIELSDKECKINISKFTHDVYVVNPSKGSSY